MYVCADTTHATAVPVIPGICAPLAVTHPHFTFNYNPIRSLLFKYSDAVSLFNCFAVLEKCSHRKISEYECEHIHELLFILVIWKFRAPER
jgi:hypothetical protein